uniref:Uncharacterized protein n=1 Tax=Sinocyclocheilus grahami TaxID=75366 RepID=A0A672Q0E1_SINGR
MCLLSVKRSVVLGLFLCAVLPLINAGCFNVEHKTTVKFCQDTTDNTWHPTGSVWRNSKCFDCNCSADSMRCCDTGSGGGSENQSLSDITICLTQCNTSHSHRVDQVVDCGLWNVGPPLFNGCAKLLDIGRNWNTLSYTPIQSIPNMLNG